MDFTDIQDASKNNTDRDANESTMNKCLSQDTLNLTMSNRQPLTESVRKYKQKINENYVSWNNKVSDMSSIERINHMKEIDKE